MKPEKIIKRNFDNGKDYFYFVFELYKTGMSINVNCLFHKSYFKKLYSFKVKEPLNMKEIYFFVRYFSLNKEYRENLKNVSLDRIFFPNETPQTISLLSLKYNIKKINEGERKRINNLTFFSDEFSSLHHSQLHTLLSKKEIKEIDTFLNSLNLSEKNCLSLKNSAYRWILRGLSIENTIHKIKNDNRKRLYFIKHKKRKYK